MTVVEFDYQIFARQRFGGVSRYFISLAEQLHAQRLCDVRIIAPLHVNDYLRKVRGPRAFGWPIKRPPFSSRLLTALNGPLRRAMHKNLSPDVLHETYYAKSPRVPINTSVVTTVHDLIHETRPREFNRFDNLAKLKCKAIARADAIICVSEHTRRDLIEYYKVSEDRVFKIYLGASLYSEPDNSPQPRTEAPYVLYVGRRSGYKNFYALLKAMCLSKRLFADFSLVCFGGGRPSAQEMTLIKELRIPPGKIKFLGGSDALLAAYYRHATALLFPSLHEGFGLPVLEAMSLGCPVVCSDRTSIPEVAGDAAVYFDPESTDDILEKLELTLFSSSTLQDLRTKGYNRAQLFSWGACARETMRVYQKLI